MNKTASIVIGIIIILIVGGIVLSQRPSGDYAPTPSPTDNGTSTSTGTSTTTSTSTSSSYTLAEVATHNGKASCWTTISGGVYNLTTWIGQHPGGEQAILSICGKDGTSAFTGQHGMDPRAQSVLPQFKIGTLAK